MTIDQAIKSADKLKNNLIDEGIKVRLLSELDGRIYSEITNPYAETAFNGYGDDTPRSTELLVPYPYDGLYVTFLEKEICRINNEIPKYNGLAEIFNESYEAFKLWYVRTHKITTPETPKITFPMRRY